MPHPLVDQLRFTRSEFARALDGVSPEDATRRLLPMNCLSWIVGHLAYQEDTYWNLTGNGRRIAPELYDWVRWDGPATCPDVSQVWNAWRRVTAAADPYLDTLTVERLAEFYQRNGKPVAESVGTLLQRVTYHYWYHLGESQAIRQLLGHTGLGEFVGDFGNNVWRPG